MKVYDRISTAYLDRLYSLREKDVLTEGEFKIAYGILVSAQVAFSVLLYAGASTFHHLAKITDKQRCTRAYISMCVMNLYIYLSYVGNERALALADVPRHQLIADVSKLLVAPELQMSVEATVESFKGVWDDPRDAVFNLTLGIFKNLSDESHLFEQMKVDPNFYMPYSLETQALLVTILRVFNDIADGQVPESNDKKAGCAGVGLFFLAGTGLLVCMFG